MKVLLLNGSPHPKGCVFTALTEVASAIEKHKIETEIFQLGNKPIRGCAACFQCHQEGAKGCVFQDTLYSDFVTKMKESDGLIVGSPVYFAGPTGSLCAFLDRVFFSASEILAGKPAACVVNTRRSGATSTFDRLNKYFSILQMPIVSSQYWNLTHGMTPDEVRQDLEGLQTMRTLGENMAFLLQSIANGKVARPEHEPIILTNFIR